MLISDIYWILWDSGELGAGGREQVAERRAESGERRAESGERRAESGERRAESGEQRAESGERRAESGERRAESGERRIVNLRNGIAYESNCMQLSCNTLHFPSFSRRGGRDYRF